MLFKRSFISGLVAGLAILAAATPASVGHGRHGGSGCCDAAPSCCGAAGAPLAGAPGAAPTTAAAAPATQMITVMELVPETYVTQRTTYKIQHVTEAYTAYREVCVPEQRVVTRHVTRKVPEWREEVRTRYQTVCTTECRTVMKKVTVCKPVTTITRKCVDQGHWECREVPAREGLCERIRKHRNKGCADPCDPCAAQCEPCPKMVTKKVWCPNKVWIEVPCTKIVKCTECVPTTVNVTVKKCVPVCETVRVCHYRCVTECVNETITVNVRKCVPYQATRCVAKCVPCVENVTCTRMVCRPVQKCVPVCPCPEPCAPACCEDTCGSRGAGRMHGLFGRGGRGGRHHRGGGDCCDSGCGNGGGCCH
jgi:hypothetical protein